MTLGGLVKHMALVEADWLAVKLAGQRYDARWDAVDFEAHLDLEWRTGALDAPEEIYALWRAAVERSRVEAHAHGAHDALVETPRAGVRGHDRGMRR